MYKKNYHNHFTNFATKICLRYWQKQGIDFKMSRTILPIRSQDSGRILRNQIKLIDPPLINSLANVSVLRFLAYILVIACIAFGCTSTLNQQIWRGSGGTQLHEAIYAGNTATIRSRVSPSNVNSRDDAGNTLLHWATANGNLKLTEILIEAGAEIDATNNEGDAPIHLAARFGHTEVTIFLIDRANADKNIQNNQGFTPLHMASLYGQADFITMLFEKGVDKDIVSNKRFGPLHTAVHSNNIQTIQVLLANEIDVDLRDNFGNTPFQHAILFGNVEMSKLLLGQGANLNHQNFEGNSGLHLLSSSKLTNRYLRNMQEIERQSELNVETDIAQLLTTNFSTNFALFQLLISEGAQIDAKNKLGQTPLQTAVLANNIEFIRSIISAGVNIENQDSDGNTAIHLAVIENFANVVEFLARNDAKVNTANFSGDLPIHSASLTATADIIGILVRFGADLTIRNNSGRSPIHLAVYSQNLQTAKALIDNGAKVEIRDSNNNTALHYVAYAGITTELLTDSSVNQSSSDTESQIDQAYNQTRNVSDVEIMIELLLESGATINALDNEGNTPLHSAALIGHIETIEKLLLAGADQTITNNSGQTPLQLAEKFGRTDVARIMRSYNPS